jgi:hypothetical protein
MPTNQNLKVTKLVVQIIKGGTWAAFIKKTFRPEYFRPKDFSKACAVAAKSCGENHQHSRRLEKAAADFSGMIK